MSGTPETDGLMDVWRVGKLLSVSVMLEHARKLERERNSLQDQRDFAISEIERLQYQLRHTVSQRDIARACRPYQGGQESALLELGATQAAVAEVLGLTETPTTADEVRQALRGVVGLAEALTKTQNELKAERDAAREKLSHAQALLAEMQDALKLAVKQLLGKKDA